MDPNETHVPEPKIIPLMALVGKDRVLIFDAATVNSEKFDKFSIRNHRLLQGRGRGKMKIPQFEVGKLGSALTKAKQMYLEVIKSGEPAGYETLLSELIPQSTDDGHFCFIADNKETRGAVIAAARKAGLRVQLFSINADGELIAPPPAPQKKERKPQPERRYDGFPNSKPDAKQQSQPFKIKKQPERIKAEMLRTSLRPAPGVTVYDSNRQQVRLGKVEMSHANASTYESDRPGLSAKIYNPQMLASYLRDKCLRMIGGKIKRQGLCWPIDALYDSNGVFVGYLMPTPKGKPLHICVFKQAGLKNEFPNWNKLNLCHLALTIMHHIKYLHDNNVLMGCVNPAAIRVVSDTEVYLVETDNYQIDGFPSLLNHNTTFTPPELLGKPFYFATHANENYAVALLAFMLMMPGKMPYVLSPDCAPEDSIKKGKFPFPFGNVHGDHANPSMWRFMWSHLSPFKHLFYNTFQNGGSFNAPNARKSVNAFIATLNNYIKELEHPTDPESLRLVPRTFKRSKNEQFYRCSCCGVEHPQFYFYREKVGANAVCNGCLDKRSEVSFTCECCHKTYYYSNRLALFHSDMRERNSDWRKQRYCSDCKSRTDTCVRCGDKVPTYELDSLGRCRKCHKEYREATYARRICECGREFIITNGEHEYFVEKGISDPRRCKECREKRKKF